MRSGHRGPDLKGKCRESRMFSATNFTVSFGDNKFILFDFLKALADRDITAYLRPTLTLTYLLPFFLLMNNQLTRRADKRNPIFLPHLEQDKEIRFFIEECDGFTVHSG